MCVDVSSNKKDYIQHQISLLYKCFMLRHDNIKAIKIIISFIVKANIYNMSLTQTVPKNVARGEHAI